MTLDEKIAQAQRHVENGRLIVERQRVIVARDGKRSSIELLKCFEQTQQIFEMDLADLLKIQSAFTAAARATNPAIVTAK